jgi:hypothetical protein
MKRLLLATALGLGLLAPASAQINFTPQAGITAGYFPKVTYSSAFFGLVPPTATGDFLCISGSASKVVRLGRISVGGTSNAITNGAVTVLRRASLDTGGVAASTTANPGITTQIAARDTGQAPNTSATAVLVSYTTVPTIVDTAPVYLDSGTINMGTTSTADGSGNLVFDWSKDNENNIQPPTLRGATQQICLNFDGVSPGTALLNGVIMWTEE